MKREAKFLLVIFLVMIIAGVLVSAQETQDPKVAKAYSCLDNKIKDNCASLPFEDKVFSVLATGKCSSELEDTSKDDQCWPSSGCKIRETALAVLAFNRIGEEKTEAEDWLLAQTAITTDLIWNLEIDTQEESTCKISYEGVEKSVTVKENKQISSVAGNYLSLAPGGYWLRINEACYNNNFTISCDKDFKTTLLYSKKNSPTIYVSSKTNSASGGETTEEKVNAFCFKTGNTCDYEGSLWATLALIKAGKDVSQFIPYIMAMEDENTKYFPSSFLYMITDNAQYFSEIINLQTNEYWKIASSPYNQFYDTSLALLALIGTEQTTSTKTYLLGIQGANGCWNDNIKDTAFILYAAWPEQYQPPQQVEECENYNYFCTAPAECSQADKLNNYVCYGGEICCKTQAKEQTCSVQEGITCQEGQTCTGDWILASDTTKCCLGSCINQEQITECEMQNYTCRNSCADDEEETVDSCNGAEVCCKLKPASPKSNILIWALVTLIALVALGIIFRKRLRGKLFTLKGSLKKGPSRTIPGGFPPVPPQTAIPRPRMILPRQYQTPRPTGPIRKPATKTDKELEETLRKLKEMSK